MPKLGRVIEAFFTKTQENIKDDQEQGPLRPATWESYAASSVEGKGWSGQRKPEATAKQKVTAGGSCGHRQMWPSIEGHDEPRWVGKDGGR